MGKDINLRKTCLLKNFLIRAGIDRVRCSNQDSVKEAVVDAPSQDSNDLPQSSTNLGKQQPATENAEKTVVGEIPSKRLLEDGSQALMPPKKKREILNTVRQHSKFLVSDLSVLPQIKVPVSRKSQPVPSHVLQFYSEAEELLDEVDRVIDAYFVEDEENKENSCNKDSTSAVLSADDEDLAFKEIATLRQKHEYKEFCNGNLSLGRRLRDGIELSNEYLATLRQAIKLLPVHPDYVPKLIAKFNKVFLSYKANPVHKQLKTVYRNLVLVKLLFNKFNNKHGLATRKRDIGMEMTN